MYTRNEPIVDRINADHYLVDIKDRSFELACRHRSIWKAYEVTEDSVRFIETFPTMREAMTAIKAMA